MNDTTTEDRALLRHLRLALGRGGSIDVDGMHYASVRVAVTYSGGNHKTEDVLARRDGQGNWAALQLPRSQGRTATRMRLTQRAADGTATTAAVTTARDAMSDTAARADAILAAVRAELRTSLEGYVTALESCGAAAPEMSTRTMRQLGSESATTVAAEAQALAALRSTVIPTAASATVRAARDLARSCLNTMVDNPESVAAFSALGYTVSDGTINYATGSARIAKRSAILLHNGVAVAPPLTRLVEDNSAHLEPGQVPSADAVFTFLADSARLRPLIGTAPRQRGGDAAITQALTQIREALGGNRAVATESGTIYGLRTVTVSLPGAKGAAADVLFAINERDERIPAVLPVPALLEWPLDGAQTQGVVTLWPDATNPVFVERLGTIYGAAAELLDGRLRCVDDRLNQPARVRAVAEVAEVTRSVVEAECAVLEEYRDLLTGTGTQTATTMVAAINKSLEAAQNAEDVPGMLAALGTIRTDTAPAAKRTMAHEGVAAIAQIARLINVGGRAYDVACELGYTSDAYNVQYSDGKRLRQISTPLLTYNGRPIQTPPMADPNDPSYKAAAGQAGNPSGEEALRLLRDLSKIRSVYRTARGVA